MLLKKKQHPELENAQPGDVSAEFAKFLRKGKKGVEPELKFLNSAKPIDDVRGKCIWMKEQMPHNYYSYDKVSPLLYLWKDLFQAVVSQVATKILTGNFHERDAGIYKCEGGVLVPGMAEVCLMKDHAYVDMGGGSQEQKQKIEKVVAGIVSQIVCDWEPQDPVNSMFESAADYIGASEDSCSTDDISKAIEKMRARNVFSANSLSAFFDHNPFSKFPVLRAYHRYCLTHFTEPEWSDEKVDQLFADEDMGEKFLQKLREVGKSKDIYFYSCSSERSEDKGLQFWINDGGRRDKAGWYTKEEVEALIVELS